MKPPLYVAAPFAGADPMEIAWNIHRAAFLARLAVLEGYAPILVHPSIPLIFGDETDASRAIGLACNTSVVEVVGRTVLGRLWILETEAGELTSGTRAELVAWARARGSSKGGVSRGPWAAWETCAQRHRLGEAWARLGARPEALAAVAGLPGELQAFGDMIDRIRQDPELAARVAAELRGPA